MKKQIILIIFLFLSLKGLAQHFEMNIHAATGLTSADLYSRYGYTQDGEELYSYGGYGQFLVGMNYSGTLAVGMELGYSRLYYFEYFDSDIGMRFWGTESSLYPGMVLQYLNKNFYVQTAIDFHNGLTIGIPAGIGFKIPIGKDYYIPVGIRADFIFDEITITTYQFTLGIAGILTD